MPYSQWSFVISAYVRSSAYLKSEKKIVQVMQHAQPALPNRHTKSKEKANRLINSGLSRRQDTTGKYGVSSVSTRQYNVCQLRGGCIFCVTFPALAPSYLFTNVPRYLPSFVRHVIPYAWRYLRKYRPWSDAGHNARRLIRAYGMSLNTTPFCRWRHT